MFAEFVPQYGYATFTLTNNTFSGNSAAGNGGGAWVDAGSGPSPVILTSNTFSGNSAAGNGGGAAVATDSGNGTVTDNTFSGNSAALNGGGAFMTTYSGNATLTNNTFNHNSATRYGGGTYVYTVTALATADIYNNIIWGNTANAGGNDGNDLYVNSGGDKVNLYNNDLGENGNFATGQSEDLYITNTANYNHGENIKKDPLLSNPDNGDLHLTANSPCIDVGCNTAPQIPATDFEGNNRILDGDGDRIPVVDMGADEYQPVFFAPPAAPSDVEASTSGCQAGCVASVTLKWNAVRGADGYLIYNADANQLWKWVKDGTATSYTFNNLPCGRTYHFYIKTHSYTGNSQPSKTVAVQIPACSGSGGTDNPAVSLAWPEDNSAINYNDFDAADYLVVFAWNQVENAKGYLLWLKLDDGTNEPMEASVVLSASNGLIEAGNLAGIYFVLDKAGWNSLVPYTVTWQVSALSDPNDLNSILATSPKASFTFNEAK